MWKAAKGAAVGLLGSKKAMMAFISAITWGAAKFGFHADTETLLPLVGPMWGYIAAQAGADWGKESEKIAQGSASPEMPE
jgi:hypothetical protein